MELVSLRSNSLL